MAAHMVCTRKQIGVNEAHCAAKGWKHLFADWRVCAVLSPNPSLKLLLRGGGKKDRFRKDNAEDANESERRSHLFFLSFVEAKQSKVLAGGASFWMQYPSWAQSTDSAVLLRTSHRHPGGWAVGRRERTGSLRDINPVTVHRKSPHRPVIWDNSHHIP